MRKLVVAILSAIFALPAIAAQPICPDPEQIKLAQEYNSLTHFREITGAAVAREIGLGWKAFKICTSDRCEENLNTIIVSQTEMAIGDYERDTVNLFALKLTKEQLLAAIAFVKSPAGTAIAEMTRKMVPDIADMNHAFSMRVSTGIFQAFCLKEAEACKRAMTQASAKASFQ